MGIDLAYLPGLATHYATQIRGYTRVACGTSTDRLTADLREVDCWRCRRTRAYRNGAAQAQKGG